MTDIFISYSRQDTAFVRRLHRELTRFKVRGFLDTQDLALGADLSRQVRDTIRNSDALVVVLSESAVRSNWVMAELGIAQSLGKDVIPVLAPGESFDRAVPPDLLDQVVIASDDGSIEQTAANVVAAATGTSIEQALASVETSRRRRRVVLLAMLVLLAALAFTATVSWRVANEREQAAEELRRDLQALEEARAEERVRLRKASEILSRGVANAQRGKLSEAIDLYRNALELDPENSNTLQYLGYAELRRAQIKPDSNPDGVRRAIEALQKATSIDPNHVWAHYNLALAYWEAGDKDKAIASVKRVIELAPSFAGIIASDPQFSPFRRSEEFRELIEAPPSG